MSSTRNHRAQHVPAVEAVTFHLLLVASILVAEREPRGSIGLMGLSLARPPPLTNCSPRSYHFISYVAAQEMELHRSLCWFPIFGGTTRPILMNTWTSPNRQNNYVGERNGGLLSQYRSQRSDRSPPNRTSRRLHLIRMLPSST